MYRAVREQNPERSTAPSLERSAESLGYDASCKRTSEEKPLQFYKKTRPGLIVRPLLKCIFSGYVCFIYRLVVAAKATKT